MLSGAQVDAQPCRVELGAFLLRQQLRSKTRTDPCFETLQLSLSLSKWADIVMFHVCWEAYGR